MAELNQEVFKIKDRIQVLQGASGCQSYIEAAQVVLDETGDELTVISNQYKVVVEQIQDAFDVYLRAVRKLKPLEDASGRLQQQRETASKVMPRGTPTIWAGGVDRSVMERQIGPAFICMDKAKIINAFKGK